MKSKRGQQELIVTVLLVLIAIVAVVLIATFITRYVREGTAAATSKAQCGKLMLTVTEAKTTSVKIRREDSTPIAGSVNVSVFNSGTGAILGSNTAALPGVLGTITVTVAPSLAAGTNLEVNALLPDGTICPGVTTATATA